MLSTNKERFLLKLGWAEEEKLNILFFDGDDFHSLHPFKGFYFINKIRFFIPKGEVLFKLLFWIFFVNQN